jgi:polyphosphate kinase
MPKRYVAPELYLNRELGQLEFNRRVLALAEDRRIPALERLRFLCIVDSNIDEFFEIRIAGLKEEIAANAPAGPDGMALSQVFSQVASKAQDLVARQYQVLNDSVLPQLASEGIRFLRRGDWNTAQKEWVKSYFFRELIPVLTPIGLDPAHPFPRLLNKSLNFVVELEGKDAFGRKSSMAIVQAPRVLPRVIAPLDFALRVWFCIFVVDPARSCCRALSGYDGRGLLSVSAHA